MSLPKYFIKKQAREKGHKLGKKKFKGENGKLKRRKFIFDERSRRKKILSALVPNYCFSIPRYIQAEKLILNIAFDYNVELVCFLNHPLKHEIHDNN